MIRRIAIGCTGLFIAASIAIGSICWALSHVEVWTDCGNISLHLFGQEWVHHAEVSEIAE